MWKEQLGSAGLGLSARAQGAGCQSGLQHLHQNCSNPNGSDQLQHVLTQPTKFRIFTRIEHSQPLCGIGKRKKRKIHSEEKQVMAQIPSKSEHFTYLQLEPMGPAILSPCPQGGTPKAVEAQWAHSLVSLGLAAETGKGAKPEPEVSRTVIQMRSPAPRQLAFQKIFLRSGELLIIPSIFPVQMES